ncbi:hypothetical protein [Mesorhizobium onobrychidis]|uniref:Uncharacterized protein n=1 Tax=Mesorhizobium onobrychidis TaxID=2775404 RepID=A0ABY5QU50_9HYPH|nr:hypothetical protein [Mesorhizobium onobrychidis]UVC14721.1 hypothetical protein IHQ72_29580 [Mesorhizobium onobrychidis]
MRISRMLMPFACLATAIALSFFAAPSANFDYGERYSAVSWQAPDLSSVVVYIVDHVAIVADASAIRTPTDAHKAAYIRANNPLATWRTAADVTFNHIDPHIAAG